MTENLPPISRAVGNRNMFTIECSKVMAKNSMIGIHMAITLPGTVVEIIAPTTDVALFEAAEVQVEEVEGNPGYYSAKFFLRPHYQLEGLTVSLRLVSKLPSAKAG